MLWATGWKIPKRGEEFFLVQNIHTGYGDLPASYSMSCGLFLRGKAVVA